MLPTNTRPAATVGCPDADVAPANPNAHFSLRLGMSAAVNPAACAVWKRVLAASFPHPFHIGIPAGSGSVAPVGQRPISGSALAVAPAAARNDATACLSAVDRS